MYLFDSHQTLLGIPIRACAINRNISLKITESKTDFF
jgi:hypothetical protein